MFIFEKNTPKLHIANTFFEWELENEPHVDLMQAFAQNPIFLQLQFLPLLYGASEDGVLIAGVPDPGYTAGRSFFAFSSRVKAPAIELAGERIVLNSIQSPPPPVRSRDFDAEENAKNDRPAVCALQDVDFGGLNEIESWGHSRLIHAFAQKKRLHYTMPPWELVREVNSKRFSFECSPKLPHATLLTEEAHAKQWLRSFAGRKVLKSCYGVSGKGHLIIDADSPPQERILAFLKREWKKGLPVIAEPYVHRLLDFSTQWEITKDKHLIYVGATLCANDDRGQYRYNVVGEESLLFAHHLPYLEEHRKTAEPILHKIAEAGFFGNVGVDAMLYTLAEDPKQVLLHPVVEINARKTMGWAALLFQKKHYPGRLIRFSFAPGTHGLLPRAVSLDGKNIVFKRNLHADFESLSP
jgi:hypothetical protein